MGADEDAELASEDAEINGQLHAIFEHVNTLAEKMGDTDIDPLLDEKNVKEWEQLLTDTETGKLSYPDAVAKMEKILSDAPAALKLADATGAIELVEQDGGKKGVNELTNFRNLLKQVKRLPEYATVLEEFTALRTANAPSNRCSSGRRSRLQTTRLTRHGWPRHMSACLAPSRSQLPTPAPARLQPPRADLLHRLVSPSLTPPVFCRHLYCKKQANCTITMFSSLK